MNTTNFAMKESVFDIFATMNSQINYKEDCYYENNQKNLVNCSSRRRFAR